MNYEYECALTGMVEEGIFDEDSDGLGDLPVGWTRVQMTRRAYNPKWILIQQVKQGLLEASLQQVPEELREYQRYAISVQVEAQFHHLEKSTAQYLPDIEDTVYISGDGAVLSALNEVREMLGLDVIEEEEEDEGEEEEEEIEEVGDEPQEGDEAYMDGEED